MSVTRPAAELSLGPLRSPRLGHEYVVAAIPVDPVEAAAFAAVVGDPDMRLVDAHPCFVVNPAMRGLEALLGDDGVGTGFAHMLHAQCDMWFVAPLRPGQLVSIAAVISEAGGFGTRSAYRIASEVRDDDGRLLIAIDNIVAFTGRVLPGVDPSRRLRLDAAPAQMRPALAAMTRTVDAGFPRRYAQASRDTNPIHLDDSAARDAGLPGVIAHGLSIFALGATTVVASVGGGDPQRLRRMRVRFNRPLLPDRDVRFEVFETDHPECFALTATADGHRLWRQAFAEVHHRA